MLHFIYELRVSSFHVSGGSLYDSENAFVGHTKPEVNVDAFFRASGKALLKVLKKMFLISSVCSFWSFSETLFKLFEQLF